MNLLRIPYYPLNVHHILMLNLNMNLKNNYHMFLKHYVLCFLNVQIFNVLLDQYCTQCIAGWYAFNIRLWREKYVIYWVIAVKFSCIVAIYLTHLAAKSELIAYHLSWLSTINIYLIALKPIDIYDKAKLKNVL